MKTLVPVGSTRGRFSDCRCVCVCVCVCEVAQCLPQILVGNKLSMANIV